MAMMDGKDAGRSLTATIGSFIQDRLIDSASRSLHKDQCAERLAASASSTSPISSSATFQYSDQAVLANLDWGIDALEEAISTSHSGTKFARLGHAEKMLKVCAMLDSERTTAGVPNSYLSVWAHLHLAYLYRLRNDSSTSTLHAIEMFLVDPFFARIDFAPKLWEALFLPHMGSIVGSKSSNPFELRSLHNESEEEASPSRISLPTSEKLTPRTRPPKDFVCPITGQLFIDPVTLETGQTYERRAIHEWLKRGNTTCPITRQPLSSTVLPKTNYVLKRLITSWREQYPDLAQDFSYSETPRTSVSPISSRGLPFQPTLDNKDEVVKGDRIKRFTRPAVSTSPTKDLQECEAAVLNIARVWKDSKDGPGIHAYLAKPTNVNGLVEILSASINRDVLRASVYIISDLIYADESVAETLTSVDSDLDCLAALLKNGLSEAAVLIYQMKLTYAQLSGHELVPSLVQVIINKGEELDDFRLVIEPKDSAIALLEVMLLGGDERSRSLNALSVVAANGVPALIKCLDRTDGRLSVMAPMEQQPAIANLLLQLDLLVEPRKMSIYREEAIEALIEALRKKEFPVSQIMALEVLASLSGHLTAEGKPSIEAWLLKTAGLDQSYNAMMKEDRMQSTENESIETMEEEQKAVRDWEKRVSFILCNHDNGSIFKALEECLKSNSLGVAKSCLVVATWLVYMLTILPDTGVRVAACQSLLNQFMNVLQSSKNLEERVLAALALKGFISDPDALQGMGLYAKSICKSLRKLKRCSAVAADILKALMSLLSVNTVWSCTEMAEVDVSVNGEVLALAYHEGRIFSCHSDGTIKIWEAGKKGMKLIQEVQEHSKAVTCLYISSSSDKLYSGSLDKTIRVWVLRSGEIHCIQVHDMKEAVHTLVANTKFACYTSQGTGAKVYNWDGASKHITFSKHVKCLAMTEKHLYCGCTAYTIQEADLSKYTSTSFFSGTRKLLGKQTIHALCIHKGLLYAGGSSVDAIAGKVFSLSTKATIGSLSTGFDIHCIAVNSEFVFTGTKCGIVEVWLRERLARVTSIKTSGGGNTKVNSLVLDSDKDMLFAGCSDGKIQVWALD
ncbi:putative E3 ubiquitin-protein ligase LIN-1 [Acorus calamus]|uniref:RING-type E3 ubiquitin transferase n=1 Tax=Acorus calamus TaxID=4465 RepID=A0AAV9D488_ACOCL|nr:putative E3 ubiquitin-protein ligase LIN-1 [Acorus calamus]